MSCEDDEITAYFSGVIGDDWHQEYTADAVDGVTWDDTTLLVQIRTLDGVLIASSGAEGGVDDVIDIDTSGTDLSVDPLVFEWKTVGDTSGVDPEATCVIEAQCEVNGFVTTFMSHEWTIRRQYAYEEVGS